MVPKAGYLGGRVGRRGKGTYKMDKSLTEEKEKRHKLPIQRYMIESFERIIRECY